MTAELRSEIYDLRLQGMSQSGIARQLGIGRRSVYQALQEMCGDPYERPDPACIIKWCDRRRHSSIGYCEAHLYRHKRGLPLDGAFLVKEWQPARCVAKGCEKKPKSLGYCATHNAQYRKHGAVKPIRTVWEEVTYHGAHQRCGALWGAAKHHPCVECGKPAADWAYDGTDPTERHHDTGIEDAVRSIIPYSRFPEFYMPMCKACHKRVNPRQNDRSQNPEVAWNPGWFTGQPDQLSHCASCGRRRWLAQTWLAGLNVGCETTFDRLGWRPAEAGTAGLSASPRVSLSVSPRESTSLSANLG